jgi:Ca2+-binding EF-hand superfamily protein
VNDHLSYTDFLTLVHEYWYPIDEDRQHLEEAFDILDPKRTAKLMIDDFSSLLRNCDWPEDEIDLILSQVSCGDGYFLYDGKIFFFYLNISIDFDVQ